MKRAAPLVALSVLAGLSATAAVAQTPSSAELTRLLNGSPSGQSLTLPAQPQAEKPVTQAAPRAVPQQSGTAAPVAAPQPSSAPAGSSDLTRQLNAAPRGQAVAPSVQAQPARTPAPTPAPVTAPVATPTRAPVAAAPRTVVEAPKPEVAAPARAPEPSSVPVSRTRTPEAPAPARAAVAEPASLAVADLPFRIDLQGAQIVERDAGAGSKIYSVRRGAVPLLMIYSGPMSQYPIYEGEQVLAGGRYSVVVAQDGRRNAVEHLFRKEGDAPWDLHIWLVATEGADGAMAEAMAQSVEPR